jgi:hypothetical protein
LDLSKNTTSTRAPSGAKNANINVFRFDPHLGQTIRMNKIFINRRHYIVSMS